MSWEKTVEDYIYKSTVSLIGKLAGIITRFDNEGAIYTYKKDNTYKNELYFIPDKIEYDLTYSNGEMPKNIISLFTVNIAIGLIAALESNKKIISHNVIKSAIDNGREYILSGYGEKIENPKFNLSRYVNKNS